MTPSYPIFAQIRAERAAREQRGVVLPFPSPPQPAPITWPELYQQCAMEWVEVFDDIQGAMWDAALSVLDVIDFNVIRAARLERERKEEAQHTGRLIREMFLEY